VLVVPPVSGLLESRTLFGTMVARSRIATLAFVTRPAWIVAIGSVGIAMMLSGCSSESSGIASTTTASCTPTGGACSIAKLMVTQTHEFELAGATHKQAVCLAAVTSRMKAPPGAPQWAVIGTASQEHAIDGCHVDSPTLNKISRYLQHQVPF